MASTTGSRCRNCREFDVTYNETFTNISPPANLFGTIPPSSIPTFPSGIPVAESLAQKQQEQQQRSHPTKPNGLDILVAIFFFIAATWLILAVFYALLALLVLRLRARGQLDIYEENFGRFHCFGAFYIPLGCILRRYVVALGYDQAGSTSGQNGRGGRNYHFITRQERRLAVEQLLSQQVKKDIDAGPRTPSTKEMTVKEFFLDNSQQDTDDDADFDIESAKKQVETERTVHLEIDTLNLTMEEPVCSICLEKYEDDEEINNAIYSSQSCSHRFHTECILEWLERRSNTECPCCREPLVTDEQVWQTVKDIRRENRKMLRKAQRRDRKWFGGLNSYFGRHHRQQQISPSTPDIAESHNIDNATSAPSGVSSSEAVSLESSSVADAVRANYLVEEQAEKMEGPPGVSDSNSIEVAASSSSIGDRIPSNGSKIVSLKPLLSGESSIDIQTSSSSQCEGVVSTGESSLVEVKPALEENQVEEEVVETLSCGAVDQLYVEIGSTSNSTESTCIRHSTTSNEGSQEESV